MDDHQADSTGMGKGVRVSASEPPVPDRTPASPSETERLSAALRGAEHVAGAKAILRRQMRALWPEVEVFFAFVDPAQPRFLILQDDGRYVPKPGRVFALDHFLTKPDRTHAYSEHTVRDTDVLG